MDGFIDLLTRLVVEAGIDRADIYYEDSLELPGTSGRTRNGISLWS